MEGDVLAEGNALAVLPLRLKLELGFRAKVVKVEELYALCRVLAELLVDLEDAFLVASHLLLRRGSLEVVDGEAEAIAE